MLPNLAYERSYHVYLGMKTWTLKFTANYPLTPAWPVYN